MKISAVIPAYKDPYVEPTVQSLLDNSELGDQLEVIVVFDGPGSETPVPEDPRVFPIYLGKNRGMRDAITIGVAAARGQYILRADSHCLFAAGYDRILAKDLDENCPDQNWIMTATRYFLDPDKWEVMDKEPVNFEKLVIQGNKKFSGQGWKSRDKELKDVQIAETMAMQGSMWIMPKQWWLDVIKRLRTDLYGQMYQDSHEMIFYTWKAGGKMMLDKNTWFAHKHRKFARYRDEGTKENPSFRGQAGQFALDIWRDYYEEEIKPKWGI